MFIGGSKNVGGGLRVGAFTRVGGGGSGCLGSLLFLFLLAAAIGWVADCIGVLD